MLGLGALILAGVRHLRAGGETDLAEVRVCSNPIEIVEAVDDGTRLRVACNSDPAVRACDLGFRRGSEAATAGDRVTIDGQRCWVDRGGMSAEARLVRGLRIDINRATAADLQLLDGIGPALSRAIVDDRAARGPFTSVGELTRVKGIGDATMRRLARHVMVGFQ